MVSHQKTRIADCWHRCFEPRGTEPICTWARQNVFLCPPLTITGAFDVSISRHFIEPLEALRDFSVSEVNILKPVRGGGTLIADIFCAWARANSPGPFMFLLQTDQIADDHFQKVLLPTMRSVPAIRAMLDSLDRFKKTARRIEFEDGNHLHVNGPSISNLQTNAFRLLVEDECWLYPEKMGDAEGRVGDFIKQETSKILRVSQGGPKERLELDHCDWHRAYMRAAIREWEVQCSHCGKHHDAAFSGKRPDGSFWGITWDEHRFPNQDWNITRCCETIRFECPHCAKPTMDSARAKSEWNRTGRYRLTTDENRKWKSYHWEAVIDFPWVELVALWLDACNAERRGDLGPKLQFYQKRRAQFKDLASLLKGGLHFKRTAYEIVSDWPDEKMRFLTIDRQQEDTFWWTVRAWSTEKSRRLGFGKAYGWAALEEIREKFKVQPNRTLIDSGFQPKGDNGVYQACLRYGWVAVKGADEYDFIHAVKRFNRIVRVRKSYAPIAYGDPESGLGKEGRRYCRLIRFSKPQYNQRVQELVESGAWEEPATGDKETEKEYADQMAARIQRRDRDPRTGREKVYWYESPNDHARDLANMQLLGAILGELVRDPVMEIQTKSEKAETVERKSETSVT